MIGDGCAFRVEEVTDTWRDGKAGRRSERRCRLAAKFGDDAGAVGQRRIDELHRTELLHHIDRAVQRSVIGGRDEYLDRPARALLDAFRRNAPNARSFTGIVVPGARHNFAAHERELTDQIVGWLHRAGGRSDP